MLNLLRKTLALGMVAIGLCVLVIPAHADPDLPGLENLNFLQYTGSAPKDYFTNVDPTGWTKSAGGNLIFIDDSGTSNTDPASACGPTYLQTYGCPSTLAISGGYNEVEADGNPEYENGFQYLVTGLTVGTTYQLSFYQAASQQTGFTGATTEQWIVSLGTSGLVDSYPSDCPGNVCTYSNADPTADIVATPLMITPSGGMTDWNYVTVDLTADSTSDLLSFLAWGDSGSTVNEPPMVFLAGVDSPAGLNVTPEPASLLLFGTGLLGLGVLEVRRRHAKAANRA